MNILLAIFNKNLVILFCFWPVPLQGSQFRVFVFSCGIKFFAKKVEKIFKDFSGFGTITHGDIQLMVYSVGFQQCQMDTENSNKPLSGSAKVERSNYSLKYTLAGHTKAVSSVKFRFVVYIQQNSQKCIFNPSYDVMQL